jgi:hypothetical protein
MILSLAK